MKKRRLRGQPPVEPEQRTAPARPPRPAAEQPPAAVEPPPRGFKAAFRDLAERKLRELSGTLKWRGKAEAQQRAEARVRAEREMLVVPFQRADRQVEDGLALQPGGQLRRRQERVAALVLHAFQQIHSWPIKSRKKPE